MTSITGRNPADGAAPRSAYRVSATGSVGLLALLTYSLLIPTNVQFQAAGFTLMPYRAVLLASVPWIFSQIMRGGMRFWVPDYLILVMAGWIFAALSVTEGAERAFSNGFAQTVDAVLPYFLARLAFARMRNLRVFLVAIAPGYGLAGLFVLLEAVGGSYILQPLALSFFGGPESVMMGSEERWGLLRGMGPFAHPILAGLHLATLVPLYLIAGIRGWPKLVGLASGAMAVVTVSSAALIALVLSAALLIYDVLTYRIAQLSWKLFFAVSAVYLFVAELGTGSGAVNLIIRFASFNTGSGYTRVLIWRYGSESVKNNPLFGIGFAEYVRPHWMTGSIDNHWLNIAITYGIVPAAALLTAAIMIVIALARKSAQQRGVDRNALRGLAISIAVFALGAYSVALWSTTQAWFSVLLGLGAAAAIWRAPHVTQQRGQAARRDTEHRTPNTEHTNPCSSANQTYD